MKSNLVVIITIILILATSLIFSSCAANMASVGNKDDGDNIKEKNLTISEYILGPSDEVSVTIWRHDDLNTTTQVTPNGMLILPLIGEIKAGGVSILRVKEDIRKALFEYIIDPKVTVQIKSYRSQKVFVLGEVRRPGVFTLDNVQTIVDAVSGAGGFTNDAEQRNVLIIRGDLDKPKLICLNLKKVLKEGDLSNNVSLQKGDIVYVPTSMIANIDRFFQRLYNILRPFIEATVGAALISDRDLLR